MKPELLAPASKETLDTAIKYGADAVYLGVKQFNARRRGLNFSVEELKEVVNKCHKQGVKVYLTMNTLVKNSEISLFFNTLKQAYNYGIDAVIIQEISFIDTIRENFPGLEIHLSTQTAITNVNQLQQLPKVDRIILPREFNLSEIKEFAKVIPTEIFIHGALCFSYSGLCLLSSFSGSERSGNRGLCAQLCRKKYNGEYQLSMKDLCLIDKIKELIDAGVSSFKIEGRLRTKQYVAEVVKAYRETINSNKKPDKEKLALAFNREFTQGFAFSNSNHIFLKSPKNQGLYLGRVSKNKSIKLETNIIRGDGIRIMRNGQENGAVITKIFIGSKEVTKANKEDIVTLKLHLNPGDELYKTSSAERISTSYQNTKKSINIKREVIRNLILPEIKNAHLDKTLLLVKTYTLEEAEKALAAEAERVFYPIINKDYTNKFGAYIPRVLNDEELEKIIALVTQHKPDYILLGNYGLLNKIKAKEIYFDYSNNCFNDIDVKFFNDKKVIPIISPELSFNELIGFKDKRFGVIVHGNIPIVTTKNKIKDKNLIDEAGFNYKVRQELNYYQLLSPRTIGLFDKILKLKENNINIFLLDVDKKVQTAVRIYKDILENNKETTARMKKGFTQGHFEKGVA